MASGLADGVIAKAQQDVPLLRSLPTGSVNVYAEQVAMDKLVLHFEVGGDLVPLVEYSAIAAPAAPAEAATAATLAPGAGISTQSYF